MKWKHIKEILYPDTDLHRQPSIILPMCRQYLFAQECQKAWAKEVILPWMREHFKVSSNMSYYYPDNYQIPDYYDDYPGGAITDARLTIEKFIYPIFLFLGTIGSLPCILILHKFSNVVWSTCFYLAILLLVDLINLYVHCGNAWYSALHTTANLSQQILLLSNSICKVYSFLTSFMEYMSVWIVVAISIEVMIFVRYPMHTYRMCTRERANAVMLLIVVLLTFINLHYFWTMGLSDAKKNPDIPESTCHMDSQDQTTVAFGNYVSPWIDVLLQNIAPVLTVSVCMVLVFLTFVNKLQVRRSVDAMLEKYFLDVYSMKEIHKVAVIICAWFIIVRLYSSICELAFMLGIEINFTQVEVLQMIGDLLDYSYLCGKPLLFISLSRGVRQNIANVIKTMTKPCIQRGRRYKISNSITHEQPEREILNSEEYEARTTKV